MLDRDFGVAGICADGMGPSCAYCHVGQDAARAGDGLDPARLAHLYLCRGPVDPIAIGEITGLDRQRVTRMLRRAGVPLRPRGACRLAAACARDDPPGLPRILAELYEAGRLSSPQIAAITGMPERTIRDRLRRYGIQVRTRGGWNREDRQLVAAEVLDDLYTRLGLSADEVGLRLGTSRSTVLRSAHALGVPVRAAGIVPVPGPEEIKLVEALYADPLIAAGAGRPRRPARAARRPDLAAVPRPGAADHPAGQGPVLGLRRRADPHRAAHRPAGHDRARVHAPGRASHCATRAGGSSFLRRWRAGLKAAWKPSRISAQTPRGPHRRSAVAVPAAVAG